MSYKSFNDYCRERFGCKVYKLSLDGGELHVDGKIDAVMYEDQSAPRASLLGRLFG